jgi:hypothetical protein
LKQCLQQLPTTVVKITHNVAHGSASDDWMMRLILQIETV